MENPAVGGDMGDPAGKGDSRTAEKDLALGLVFHATEIVGEMVELERQSFGRPLVHHSVKRPVDDPDQNRGSPNS